MPPSLRWRGRGHLGDRPEPWRTGAADRTARRPYQKILYVPGRTLHHASKIYRGGGKTDAKDAAVIADQARMRRDLQPLRAGDEISTGLRILTARPADKSADRSGRSTVCGPSYWSNFPRWNGHSTTAGPKPHCCCSLNTGRRTGSAGQARPGSTRGRRSTAPVPRQQLPQPP
ncbi:IS110 family transposase [Arthrobacter sp. R4]|uniref:IS110 family transposase n=1 Tax=Arthrobacter sp. R4 TaxID=644417 RepID=UPI003ED906C2